MGYPFGSTEFRLPNLLLNTLLLLGLISSLFFDDPPTHSPTRTDSLPDPDPRNSLSRIQDLLFPVMNFSDLVLQDDPPPPENCAVCLSDFDGGDEIRRLTNCRHVFHRSCLDPWMDDQLFIAPPGAAPPRGALRPPKTCPLCRTPFLSR